MLHDFPTINCDVKPINFFFVSPFSIKQGYIIFVETDRRTNFG